MCADWRYPAVLSIQSTDGKPVALFAAGALDIATWAGVPQRRRLAGEETVGWQREENAGRLRELCAFFRDTRNVVQNPLLCASQDDVLVRFEPIHEGSRIGDVVIQRVDLDSVTLLSALQGVAERLAQRVPALAAMPVDQSRLASALAQVNDLGIDAQIEAPDSDDDDEDDDAEGNEDDAPEADGASDAAAVLFSEETQLIDFYGELLVRIAVLELIDEKARPSELLGFSLEAMKAYLTPVVLVDGQHRLRGAVLAAESMLDDEPAKDRLIELVDAGASPAAAHEELLRELVRELPVSLLLDESPAEHVFQFVVVNQKATPMGKALLGTIVSTSLSQEELEPVAQRLSAAAIPLDESRAVAYMTREPSSPFYRLVQTGVGGDQPGLLKWSVLKSLTGVVRELNGGRLYGSSNDYAKIWRDKFLPDSHFVSAGSTDAEKEAIWSAPDGPWREVFVRFFSLIRNRFGEPGDIDAPNAWGNTSSNLYNMVSLTILVSDFFQYLCEAKNTLNQVDDVDAAVEDWLDGVKDAYFARDWKMGNLKKDQKPVKERWAKVWVEYRKNPAKLPTKYTPG